MAVKLGMSYAEYFESPQGEMQGMGMILPEQVVNIPISSPPLYGQKLIFVINGSHK